MVLFFSLLIVPLQASAEPALGFGKVLLIQTNLPWASNSNTKMLGELQASGVISGFDVCTVDNFNNGIDISQYQVIMFANDQTTSTYQRYEYISNELEFFARSGGVVVFGACDRGWGGNGYLSGKLPGGVTKNDLYQPRNYISDPLHPIVTGELTDDTSLNDADLTGNYCSHVSFSESSIPDGYNVILRGRSDGLPTLVEYPLGKGKVIASGLTWEYYYPGGPGYPTDAGPIHYGSYFSAKAFKDLVVYALAQSQLGDISNDILKVTVLANKLGQNNVPVEGADVYLYVGDTLRETVKSNSAGIAELDLSGLSLADRYSATVSATFRVATGSGISGNERNYLFNNFGLGDNGLPIRYIYELHSEEINYNGQWEGKPLRDIPLNTVTLWVTEPRILYNIAVAYLADDAESQSDAYNEKVKDSIRYAAKNLAQATDGHVMLNDVIIIKAHSLLEFYSPTYEASMADVRIETKIAETGKVPIFYATIRANAHPAGFYKDARVGVDEYYLSWFNNFKQGDLIKGLNSFYRIQMSGTGGYINWWNELGTESYAETIVHELGHYLFGFYDEYKASDDKTWYGTFIHGMDELRFWADNIFSDFKRPVTNFGLMDHQHNKNQEGNKNELSKQWTSYSYLNGLFDDDSKQSWHSFNYRESTEDTLANILQLWTRIYNNPSVAARDIPDILMSSTSSDMGYIASYTRAINHDRTASYPYALEILNFIDLDTLQSIRAVVSAYGIEQIEENGEYNAHFYISDSNNVIGYVRSDEIFGASYSVFYESLNNGDYRVVSEATRIAVDAGASGVTGEFYSEVLWLAEDVDFTSISWYYYDDGAFIKLPTDFSINSETQNLGARCDYVGNGVYVLMAKGASGSSFSSVTNLGSIKSLAYDGLITLGFDDGNNVEKVAFYEIVYSETPFASVYDSTVNRAVYFPTDDGKYYLNLYEPNRVAYVGIIVHGIHGEISPLSEVIQVIGGEADRDGDGIPDWWCDKYHLWDKDGAKDIANSDDNGDGITNLEHYLSETDPTAPYNLDDQNLYGDVNQDGLLNSVDASLILLHLVGKTQLTARQLELADINRDGKVDSADAAQILLIAGQITPSDVSYNRVTLKVGSKSALSGSLIDIPITISADSNCYALDFEIEYDNAFLQFDTAQRFGLFELEQLNSPQDGKVNLAFAGDNPLTDGDTVAVLTFRVLKTCDPATELKINNNHVFGFNSNLDTIEIPNMTVSGWVGTNNNIIPVTGVALDKNSLSISVGSTEQLVATILPSNAVNKNVMWSSSDESVAIVYNGLVIGVKAGTAVITVETYDGNYVASATVTVLNGNGEIISITGISWNNGNGNGNGGGINQFSLNGITLKSNQNYVAPANFDATIGKIPLGKNDPTAIYTITERPVSTNTGNYEKVYAIKVALFENGVWKVYAGQIGVGNPGGNNRDQQFELLKIS